MTDREDRSRDPLPARRSINPPPVTPPAGAYEDFYQEAPAPAGKRPSMRLLGRALRRHWWQALLIWLAGSGGLMALAYFRVKPTYDAFSEVQVEGGEVKIGPANATPVDPVQYMQTQVAQVTNPAVLGTALAEHPELTALALLRGAADPEAEIRRAVRVANVRGTSLIKIEMSSQVPAESAAVVNAVVEAFLKHAQGSFEGVTVKRVEQLKVNIDSQEAEVRKQRDKVVALQRRLGAADVSAVRDQNVLTLDAYKQFSEQLATVEIMRIAEQAKLDSLRDALGQPARPPDEAQVREAVAEAFFDDPKVAAIQGERDALERKLKSVERTTARNPNDPSRKGLEEKIADAKRRTDDLWNLMEKRLRRAVLRPASDAEADRAAREVEGRLAAMKTQEDALRAKLEAKRVETRASNGEALDLEFTRSDLARAEESLNKYKNLKDQLQFDLKSPIARVSLEYKAKPSLQPNSDRRLQVMAAAPAVVGLLVVTLFLVLELSGGRVGDPDELADRVRVPILGVVPPLPQIRAAPPGGGGDGLPMSQAESRARRQLDEFVQSLDHLRVALCARRDQWGRDRHCILITSACASEGKTTLAAQLAERCVNAGMMTLVIDADLRNPTLSRMLDAADNPGLINVLRGEALAEDAVMVIGDAGGFHLLPAGGPRVDPSRLLQNERLGRLLAQARESFDMIIIDAPPVLPVPDALTIGRWVDGAVLAVRYDASRLPLVERANRRLAHVGVPVIGAVLNGVRSMESAYGGYYGYGDVPSDAPTPPPASSASMQSSVMDD